MKDTAEFDGAAVKETGDGSRDEGNAPFLLRDLIVGKPDSRKQEVLDVLWAVAEFKIYVTRQGIAVQFADDPQRSLKQIKQHLRLGAELAQLHALMDLLGAGRRMLPKRWRRDETDANRVYHREIARGIALALTGNGDKGTTTLAALAERLEKKLRNRARVFYLAICLIVTLVIGLLALLVASVTAPAYIDELALVATCGSIGALLSTAATIRRMRPDASAGPFMSWVYGGQRMLVGVLGAVVVYFAVRSGLISDVLPSTPPAPPSEDAIDWYRLAFLSVLAGFSERMVPDLLNRNGSKSGTQPSEQEA